MVHDADGDQDQNDEDHRFDIKLLEESIIPSVIELTLDSDWRVRLGIIEKFPALAQQFGLRFFDQRLFDLSLAALEDNVADIRLEAASNQLQIANVFDRAASASDSESASNSNSKPMAKAVAAADDPKGAEYGPPPSDWAVERLIPALLRKARDSKHYLHRIVYLLSFKFLVEGLGPQRAKPVLTEIVRLLSDDPVANVRFKACQIVTFWSSTASSATATWFTPKSCPHWSAWSERMPMSTSSTLPRSVSTPSPAKTPNKK